MSPPATAAATDGEGAQAVRREALSSPASWWLPAPGSALPVHLLAVPAGERAGGASLDEELPSAAATRTRSAFKNAAYATHPVALPDRKELKPQPDWTLDDLMRELNALTPPREDVGFSFRQQRRKQPMRQPVADKKKVDRSRVPHSEAWRFSVPRDLADDESSATTNSSSESGVPSSRSDRGFSYGAPAGFADSSDEEYNATSAPATDVASQAWMQLRAQGAAIAKDEVREVLYLLEVQRRQRARDEARRRHLELEEKLNRIQAEEMSTFEMLAEAAQEQRKQTGKVDEHNAQQRETVRQMITTELERDHRQRASVVDRAIQQELAAAEAAARAEAERQQLELRRRQEEEARRRQAELAAQKAEADRQAAEAAAKAQAAEEAKQRAAAVQARLKAQQQVAAQQASAVQQAVKGPSIRIAQSASETERKLAEKVQAAEQSILEVAADPNRKKERRELDKKVILHIQQISGTQQQVMKKAGDIVQLLLSAQQPVIRTYLLLTFATKLLSQCESQVQKLPSFAFPLAQVAVLVSLQVPELMELLVAKFHRACIYTVPKYYPFDRQRLSSDAEYFALIGQKFDEQTGEPTESTDDYLGRMGGYITLYAAITQVDILQPGVTHPHGLQNAWSWLARLLNRLPPNRATATALESFLKVAGYRLHQQYGRQLMKLLTAVHDEFLPKVAVTNDPDARAVMMRLQTYLLSQQFLQEPEGRFLPKTDLSSSLRA